MPLQATSGAASYDAFGGGALAVTQQAEAIDFDGTNDFLSRGDMTGNTEGNTFTFSVWVWRDSATQGMIYCTNGSGSATSERATASVSSSGQFQMAVYNSAGNQRLNFSTAAGSVPIGTWTSILVSINLGSTSDRYVYINDVSVTPTWNTYTNDTLDFAGGSHYIARYVTSSIFFDGRLSNVFLDYTYRDLSNVTNRRLFVTADLKPAAGQAALNPIMYLPMSDPTAPGLNQGTGGDFTLTGVVARSGRGPNQYNAPYSTFDGSADYLNRTTALTGIADGKQITISGNFKKSNTSTGVPFEIADSTTNRFIISVTSTPELIIQGFNSSGTRILFAGVGSAYISINRTYTFTLSVDMADTSKRHLFLNGESVPVSWYTYTNDVLDISPSTPVTTVGAKANGFSFWNGNIGALWFNTSYIDLSVAANLAKFVTGTGIDAKPVDLGATGELPTGTSPIIYLPMYGNNAGKNYGTGGDFTVNSGPYTGARGPNEYWGNKANFAGGANYLQRSSALTGAVDTKVISCSFWISPGAVSGGEYALYMDNNAGSLRGLIITWSNTNMRIQAYNSSGTQILEAYVDSPSWGGGVEWYVQLSFDLTNSAKRSLYVNGTQASVTWSPYTNQNISLTTASNVKFAGGSSNNTNTVRLSEVYLADSYIDFTQEANRLKFRDAFGNPVDLTQQIEDAAIPNPAIYMRSPPTAFGTNYGTGGNFTVNGTITDGGQL